MRSTNPLRKNSIKALAFGLLTFAVGNVAHADVVLDNLTISPSASATVGTTVGSSFMTGTSALILADVIFPQLRFNANGTSYDSYVAGESVAVNLRNPDGTVGAALFTNFSISNDVPSGQTEADASSAFTLLPNTGYYISVTAPTTTGWTFTTSTAYNTMDGVTAPATDASYKTIGTTTTYYSMASGPQLIFLEAVPVVGAVPEPSTVSMLALAVGGTLLVVRRSRGEKKA